jgi:DNA-binding CsgD family transcriptional regulator
METNTLSEREIEILKLVGQGKSNKEIAENLFISVNTVKVHLTNIFRKTGVASRTEATLYAIEHGFIDSPRNAVDEVQILVSQPGATPAANSGGAERRQKTIWLGLFLFILVLAGAYLIFSRSSLFGSDPPQTNPLTDSLTQARWRVLRPMTSNRAKMAAVAYENAIYLIGGENENGVVDTVEKYTVSSNAYESLAKKPTPVSDVGAAVIGGKIYIPGGQTSDGTLTNVLEVYDPQSDSWSARNSLPIPLSRYALTALEGTLYLFGGWDGESAVNTVLSYNPASDRWNALSAFSESRMDAQAAVLGDRIYLVGGSDGSKAVRQIEVYAPAEEAGGRQAWAGQIALPEDMTFLGSQTLSGFLFVLTTGEDGALNLMQFTPQNNTWYTYAELTPEDMAPNPSIIESSGELYFFGGQNDDGIYCSQVVKYKTIYTVVLPRISK